MFLVKKFLCCFKIEIAGFVCVIDDVIISVLSCLFAVDMMKNAPYIKEHPDLGKPVKYLIFLYSTTELIAALLVFIALIKSNSTIINAYIGYMPLSYYTQLWFFCLIQSYYLIFIHAMISLYLFLCLCAVYDQFWCNQSPISLAGGRHGRFGYGAIRNSREQEDLKCL